MGKSHEQALLQRRVPVSHCRKRCSASVLTGDAVRPHRALQMATISRQSRIKCWQERGAPGILLSQECEWHHTVGTTGDMLKLNLNTPVPQQGHCKVHTLQKCMGLPTKVIYRNDMTELSVAARNWKCPKWPAAAEWTNKSCTAESFHRPLESKRNKRTTPGSSNPDESHKQNAGQGRQTHKSTHCIPHVIKSETRCC